MANHAYVQQRTSETIPISTAPRIRTWGVFKCRRQTKRLGGTGQNPTSKQFCLKTYETKQTKGSEKAVGRGAMMNGARECCKLRLKLREKTMKQSGESRRTRRDDEWRSHMRQTTPKNKLHAWSTHFLRQFCGKTMRACEKRENLPLRRIRTWGVFKCRRYFIEL